MSATFPADVRSAKKRSRFSSRGESQKLRVTLTYRYGILQRLPLLLLLLSDRDPHTVADDNCLIMIQ